MRLWSISLAAMVAAFLLGLLIGVAVTHHPANAQDFTGYPPVNNFYVGNGAGVPPSWYTPSAARTAIGVIGSGFAPTGGRLTLQSNTPVMTTTQAAKTTLFFDCYNGGFVPIFNGTADIPLPIASCQISTAMQPSGTGVLNAGGVFDVWAVSISSTLTICVATNGSGGGWASDTGGSNTARGTGYSQLDFTTRSFVTNKNALANCYSGSTNEGTIAANQATHLGTIGTDAAAAGSVTWQYGVNGAPPTQAIFNVWNRYNRVNVATTFGDTTASWTYATATWREARADTTFLVTYTVGDAFDAIDVHNVELAASGTPGSISCANSIGVDSTTAFSGITGFSSTAAVNTPATWRGIPGTGQHKIAAIEYATGATCTFFGQSAAAFQQTGMTFNLPM